MHTIRNALASTIARGVPNKNGDGHTNLAAIGVSLEKDGTLRADSAKLDSALTNNPSGSRTVQRDERGRQATDRPDRDLHEAGRDDRPAHERAGRRPEARHAATESGRLRRATDQYQAQFTALNALMAKMNSNTQYLTRLFGGANSSGTLANK